VLKLRGEVGDVATSVLSNDEHLTKVSFGGHMALESILVATLLFANLAVPSQFLQSLRLHLVGDEFPIELSIMVRYAFEKV
jgi:hypothetical protein